LPFNSFYLSLSLFTSTPPFMFQKYRLAKYIPDASTDGNKADNKDPGDLLAGLEGSSYEHIILIPFNFIEEGHNSKFIFSGILLA